MSNPFQNAQKQVLQVYDILREQWVSYNFIEEFLVPDRVIEVHIPVKMDNGELKIFTWYRSQHKNILGPYKGWIRFHQNVSKDEVMALSVWMSVKTSVVWLPLGWGKWGIIVNPKELSFRELEELSRWYVRKLYKYLWPDFDVPAPDVNTNPQIMAWMVDEYSKLTGKWSPGTFTGKPLELGWSRWRNIATSLGGLYTLEKYCELESESLEWKTIAIQWAGNAWLNFAKLVKEKWAKIVAISDSKGWIFDEDGINIEKVEKYKQDRKSVTEIENYKNISNEEILELDVDILVLAALENQITLDNVENIKARVILELANGPIIPEADEILFKKWIKVIPDILANAWWVTVSYFEQVQGNMNFYWTEQEVVERLKPIMYNSTEDVIKLAKQHNIDYRRAAYVISLKRQYDAWKYVN
jgi:glutamate dehydrogenase/leucine dehydrogenase